MLNSSLIFRGNQIYVTEPDIKGIYRELREAVLDAKIPVTMPIGFKLNSPTSLSTTTAIERNSACLESMIAISINVSKLIMVGKHNHLTESEHKTGLVTTGNANFISEGKHEIFAINQNQPLFTAVEPLSIRFYLNTASGYQSMAKNAAIIGGSDFFPLNTMHSLTDYVSILPLESNVINVRYHNGMTPEIFEKLVKEA